MRVNTRMTWPELPSRGSMPRSCSTVWIPPSITPSSVALFTFSTILPTAGQNNWGTSGTSGTSCWGWNVSSLMLQTQHSGAKLKHRTQHYLLRIHRLPTRHVHQRFHRACLWWPMLISWLVSWHTKAIDHLCRTSCGHLPFIIYAIENGCGWLSIWRSLSNISSRVHFRHHQPPPTWPSHITVIASWSLLSLLHLISSSPSANRSSLMEDEWVGCMVLWWLTTYYLHIICQWNQYSHSFLYASFSYEISRNNFLTSSDGR